MSDSLSALVAESRSRLEQGGLPDPVTDARALICGLLDLTVSDLVLHGDMAVSPEQEQRVDAAIKRRVLREPVHRILGQREFFGLRLSLSPDTLEPRPDTEVLVEALIQIARAMVERNGAASLVDLGTGTGAIALSLLHEVDGLVATGTDLSSGALETASRNAELNGLDARFSAVESNWFAAVEGRFDIIVSNPPYIRQDVIAALEPDVREHDPILALDGGEDGLEAYRAIARDADSFLAEDGVIGLEIGYDQKQTVSAIFAAHGFSLIDAVIDYGGNDRALLFARIKL